MRLASQAGVPSLELPLSRDEIAATFDPFVARRFGPPDMGDWQMLVSGRGKKILKRRLRRQLTGWWSGGGRAPEAVEQVYEKTWNETSLVRLVNRNARAIPCIWGPQKLLAAAPGLKRVHLLHLMRLIETLQPKRVLEVGCGIGINLYVLAARFPEVHFSGIDLTAGGINAMQDLAERRSLPDELLEFSPETSLDPAAHRRVEAHQGSAAEMPFAEDSFDLIYTVTALEQMEAIRPMVMHELRRVSASHVAMIEAFRDWNASGMRRNYIISQDYFAARVEDLPAYGLQPVLATDDMPGKVNMGLGLVVAET